MPHRVVYLPAYAPTLNLIERLWWLLKKAVLYNQHYPCLTDFKAAIVFEPAPQRQKGQMGRPALKGKRRPKLNLVLTDRKTVWTSVTLTEWYGGQTRKLEYVSGTAVWYTPPSSHGAWGFGTKSTTIRVIPDNRRCVPRRLIDEDKS